MTDWQEINTKSKLIKWNQDGNIQLPTFEEFQASNGNVKEALTRFSGYFSKLNNVKIMPIISNPMLKDGDGLIDEKDPTPLQSHDYLQYNVADIQLDVPKLDEIETLRKESENEYNKGKKSSEFNTPEKIKKWLWQMLLQVIYLPQMLQRH